MIGPGLKKLAKEHNMKVAHGVGYGALRGYAATLSEGAGYKQIVLSTKIMDPMKQHALQEKIYGRNIQRELRVQRLGFSPSNVAIVFLDNPGTMKKILEFIDWFWPLLDEAGATKWDVCTECGGQVTGGRWMLVNGVAYYLHESCAERAKSSIREENDSRKEADRGNYITGLLGAFAGSALGAVLWAVVLSLGYVASVCGLVIGWLAERGYSLCRGKQGKGKVVILILAVIFGVLLGNFGYDAFTLATMIWDGELPGYALADIPFMIRILFETSPEYVSATVKNIVLGLVFAGLGVFSLLMRTGKEVSGIKVVDLE